MASAAAAADSMVATAAAAADGVANVLDSTAGRQEHTKAMSSKKV